MTPKRYFFIVLLFLYIPLFIKGYANTTNEFSDVIVPEFPLQVKFANELVDLDRLDSMNDSTGNSPRYVICTRLHH